MCRRDRKIIMLQKGQLFHNGRNGRYKGHYRTENCTKQEAPPEDERPTISRVPRCPAILPKSQRPGVFLNILTS